VRGVDWVGFLVERVCGGLVDKERRKGECREFIGSICAVHKRNGLFN